MGIKLFQHNQNAYDAAIRLMNETGKAAIIHPTGTGKSFIAFQLAKEHPDARIVWLAPSEYIFRTQLENLRQTAGDEEGFIQNITFLTYSKLMVNEERIPELLPDYIILDEFHRCGAAEWGKSVEKLLSAYPQSKILGLSATNVRYLDGQRDMAEELFDGQIASEITWGEAIVRGILPAPVYVISLYSYEKELHKWEKKVVDVKNAGVRAVNEELLEHVQEWFRLVDTTPHIYNAYYDSPETDREFAAFKKDNSRHLKLLYCIDMLNEGVHAGYVRTMVLDYEANKDGSEEDKKVDYDLAVICYGQNDGVDGFGTNYEAMVRAIQIQYPSCCIISILESSQRDYTEKMVQIQEICNHYGIPVADTIAPFQADYDSLTDDGIHPNDAGQNVYYETVKTVIEENVEAGTGQMEAKEAINDVSRFENFAWYGVDGTGTTGFKRDGDNTFILNTAISGMMGIDYTYESGENKAEIYIDGELFETPTVTFNYDFSQRHILVVSEDCRVEKEIKVVFDNSEQADGFRGMCFSWSD